MKKAQVAAVPRETSRDPAVRPLLFRRDMAEATERDIKHATRRILSDGNCHVHPGTFEGVDLDTGRARRTDPPQLRAQCKFTSGLVRVVTITPVVQVGDLFWVKRGRFGARRDSKLTLEVKSVGLCRVQDMFDEDAIEEGVEVVQVPNKLVEEPPRERFAWLWDSINGREGPASWGANPWVWVYHYRTFRQNIDAMLARWERRS